MPHDGAVISQQIRVDGGYGYGVIGADLHVHADRGPVYLLAEHRGPVSADPSWLLEQPSRLLNARYSVVDFVGRAADMDKLTAWRDESNERLAARWLFAAGGQGKTRLALEFAAVSVADGWKVVDVLLGAGARPSGSHDLRPDGHRGILVLVDYADRWPLSYLHWLLSNSLFHQQVPTRVLFLSRSVDGWASVRSALTALTAATSEHPLAPLSDPPGRDRVARPDDRLRMFRVARDAFARRYGLARAEEIPPPVPLDDPGFGLTLSLHMAALVAVDAHSAGARAPADMVGLSAYLLDRERAHWRELYERSRDGLEFRTPPRRMWQVAFIACLTGATTYSQARALLRRADIDDPDPVLTDHAVCYPPAPPSEALEPMYPDRLAEDFLALTLAGHDVAAYPAAPWGTATLAALLHQDADTAPPLPQPARPITFLTAAALRWPHLAAHLNEHLRADPTLALRGGNPSLGALAVLDGIDIELLDTIAWCFPDGRQLDLDVGMAAVSVRITAHRLAAVSTELERAAVLQDLAHRLSFAGRYEEAAEATEQAVDLRRAVARRQPEHRSLLASSLTNLGNYRTRLGQPESALAALREATELRRQAARADSTAPRRSALANSLSSMGICLAALGRHPEAFEVTRESVQLRRRLAAEDPAAYSPGLASSLHNLGNRLAALGRHREALDATGEAVRILRLLARDSFAEHAGELAIALDNLSADLWRTGRTEAAMATAGEAADLLRRLARENPEAFEERYAYLLNRLSDYYASLGRYGEAIPPALAAAEIWRRRGETDRAAGDAPLATVLLNLSGLWAHTGQWHEALAASIETVAIRRRQARAEPARYAAELAKALSNLGSDLYAVQRYREALAAVTESVRLWRQLATTDRRHVPFLAESLYTCCVVAQPVDRTAARDAAVEAVMLFEGLDLGAGDGHRLTLLAEARKQVAELRG
ncbi:Tetratricopeptide repeat-containing protein [Micromonospora coxensis]|uniref:Tetratricopeptide repeat-containing protein n=1 Tax=Micromonospora coxensis TaxID=356852 RepID=A0A1C5JZC5_9ACTN|nr:Tetratricopeptide repeat-containing protein [Micromonospora coxensis]